MAGNKHDLGVACLYCKARFTNEEAADQHMLHVHAADYYPEEYEKQSAVHYARYAKARAYHRYIIELSERLPAPCLFCAKRFRDDAAAAAHMAGAHPRQDKCT
jgi:hypothetical protein